MMRVLLGLFRRLFFALKSKDCAFKSMMNTYLLSQCACGLALGVQIMGGSRHTSREAHMMDHVYT